MLSPKFLSIAALLLLGISFASANVWFAAVRSTIPLELQGTVSAKRRLAEKKPGVDDVYLITLDGQRRIQVDAPVFELMHVNQTVHKEAWANVMEIDGRKVALDWSPDVRGMMWAMPLTLAVCVVVGLAAMTRSLGMGSQPSE